MKLLTKSVLSSLLILAACGNQSTDPQPPTSRVSPSELKAAANNSPATKFYQSNGWQAAWSAESAEQLSEALKGRAKHGLDRVHFPEFSESGDAAREVALTEAALTYASALAFGVADPEKLHQIYTVPRPQADLIAGLQGALADGRLKEWLGGLAPQDRAYAALSEAYLGAREQAKHAEGRDIPPGDLVHEGEQDPRIPQIRDVLRRLDYLRESPGTAPAMESGPASNLYSSAIADALGQFQKDRGLQPDKTIGPNTIEELNRSASDRARAAAVALERRRWLQRKSPATRIDVNTASARLQYFRDGKIADSRRVIVGQPNWETPQIRAPIYRLVVNPTWTVPKSIEEQELAGAGPSALRRRNMVRRDGWIVQLPGPDNALGLVKFDMDDPYAIYLHDTPAKSLFSRNVRQQSHGCVRVENALEFAAMLARDFGIEDEWQKARTKGDETFVRLPEQLPVRLLYHPTYVTRSGEVKFGRDIYGWNSAVAERLGYEKSSRGRRIATVEDLGP